MTGTRRFPAVMAALLLALANASGTSAQKGMVKVGFLAPMTGGAAQIPPSST